MNRLLTMSVALLLLLAHSVPAFAAADPATLEVKWNEKTVSFTTSGVVGATFDIGGFGAYGRAVLGNPATFNGADGTTNTGTSVVSSTWTNVVAFDYAYYAIGSSGTLNIAQTLRTPPPLGSANASSASFNSPFPSNYNISVPVISTSSAISFPPGVLATHVFRAQVANPVFILSSLDIRATYFLSVSYGVPIR